MTAPPILAYIPLVRASAKLTTSLTTAARATLLRCLPIAAVLATAADATADPTTDVGATAARVPTSDPTGGAYTSPTLLFTPAAALPAWNVRATLLTEVQSPYQSPDGPNPDAHIRPGGALELGLPYGFTAAAGTNWVGGDVNQQGAKDFGLGVSPYFQGRFQIYGDRSGQGFLLGTSVTYKFVGFAGLEPHASQGQDPGEVELALSAQVRRPQWEAGLMAVGGKDGATTDADVEGRAYALYRIIPQLGVGAAGQVRYGVVLQPGEKTYDVYTGGILSLTLGRFQLGNLVGATTVGLDPGQVGALGQIFGSARF